MKKFMYLLPLFMYLASCGGAGLLPTDNITFGQAMAHCSSTASYWVWIAIAAVLDGIIAFLMIRALKKTDFNGYWGILLFVMALILILAIFMRPCEVAANTSVEMMQRGHYLGY